MSDEIVAVEADMKSVGRLVWVGNIEMSGGVGVWGGIGGAGLGLSRDTFGNELVLGL